MIAPTIHINGTSGEELVSQLASAGHALEYALTAVAQAAPNARDYYVKGDTAFREATTDHVSRLERLRSVSREIVDLLYDVLEQQDARARARSGR